jgi:hypothetical protein
MTLPYKLSGIVVPFWIVSVGIVAALAPVPSIAAGLLLALGCVIVVPVIITGLLATFAGAAPEHRKP